MSANYGRNHVVGVDIGGSHISACIVEIDSGQMLPGSLFTAKVDASGSASAVLDTWAGIISTARQSNDPAIQRVGIALPGPFDYDHGISYMKGLGKYDQLYGLPVKSILAEKLGIETEKIKMQNDASSFLTGERKIGRASGCADVVGITLGTGLGSSRFRNHKTEAGDLWKFEYAGGFAEDRISTRWILNAYRSSFGDHHLDVEQIAQRARMDATVDFIFVQYGKSIGEVLSLRYGSEMPEKFVFTGGLTKSWDLFSPFVRLAFSQSGHTADIYVSEHQEIAAMVGAALLWSDDYAF